MCNYKVNEGGGQVEVRKKRRNIEQKIQDKKYDTQRDTQVTKPVYHRKNHACLLVKMVRPVLKIYPYASQNCGTNIQKITKDGKCHLLQIIT